MIWLPFPRNWIEELVAEYLQLEGYLVETGHPVPIEMGGGRSEMDVLGLKIVDDNLHVRHIEIGRARSMEELDKKIERQLLNPVIREELNKVFGTYEYEPWFISETYNEGSKTWQELKKKYESKNVRLMTFWELVQEIQKTMKKWKEEHTTKKGTKPMLPQNLWLLKMLERMSISKMLRETSLP